MGFQFMDFEISMGFMGFLWISGFQFMDSEISMGFMGFLWDYFCILRK